MGVGDAFGPGNSFYFRLPTGWIDERTNGGTVWNGLAHPRVPNGDAKVVITSLGWKVEQAQIDVWTKFLHVTDASYEPAEDATVGEGKLPARLATGRGKLGSDDAVLVYAIVTSEKGGSILMVGAVKASAGGPRTQEMLACLGGLTQRR